MKKSHILGIIIIAVAIGALIASLGNTSTYSDFTEAKNNPDTEYHVVGKFVKDKGSIYEPTINPDEFVFYLTDAKGVECKVVLHKSKPQDFERAEQIVLIGKMDNDAFHAHEILMKCPSKYNEAPPVANS
jgi:cytochrome c-type biogenesis protein CcmE